MDNTWTRRIGAAGGAVYILLGLLRGDGGTQLSFHASRTKIVTWIQANATITPDKYAMACLELAGLLCFLVFVAYLSSVLRRSEGEFGYLSTAALSAGVLSAAIKITSFPAHVVALVWAKDGVDPNVIGMLFGIGDVAFILTLATTGLMLAATAAVAIPTGALPRWLGWATLFVAVALFANVALSFLDQDFAPAMLLFMVWTLVTSIVLIRRAGSPAPAVGLSRMREPAVAR